MNKQNEIDSRVQRYRRKIRQQCLDLKNDKISEEQFGINCQQAMEYEIEEELKAQIYDPRYFAYMGHTLGLEMSKVLEEFGC